MANMSYCKFQNTANDLADCVEHWTDRELSPQEDRARKQILELAREILEMEGE